MNLLRPRASLATLCAVVLLAAAPAAFAQTTATWTGAVSNLWADATPPTNWSTGAVPGSLDTAQFNGAGNGNTSISLGNASQSISTLLFASGSAAYSLGVLNSGDTFNLTSGGAITVNSGVTAQTINADWM